MAAVLAVGFAPQKPAPAPAPQEQEILSAPEPLRITVELALIQATVRDKHGDHVRGLRKKDFVLLEDGIPQELALFSEEAGAPVRVAFLLDVSGSMALQGRLPMARGAIRYFLDGLDADDEAALFTFAEGAVEILTDFGTDRRALRDALLEPEGYGQTALIDAVARAPELLPRKDHRRAAIVLFSDGVDNISRLSIEQAVHLARLTEVPVYSVGILDRVEAYRRKKGARVLQRFSRETGGEAFFAENYYQVNQATRFVVDELKHAYVLGYYPSPESGPHVLKVEARCGGCRVTSRQGLYSRPAQGE